MTKKIRSKNIGQVVNTFPQEIIDNSFWQYVQGAKDLLCLTGGCDDPVTIVHLLISNKLEHIANVYNGRRPSFDIYAELYNGRVEVFKRSVTLPG